MSFREKSAWIILITLVVLTALYLLNMPAPYTLSPEPGGELFHTLLHMLATFVVVVVIGHIVLAIRSPREARTARDERERLIDLKATAVSSYVYATLSLGGIFVALHVVGSNQIGLGYLVLFAFIIAEIANYALRIYYYRRGF
jgi:hypothetical protein